MAFLDKYRHVLPKDKNKEELDEHYKDMELEKGDLPAMLIAALLTFGPVILVISLIYVGVALLFGMGT